MSEFEGWLKMYRHERLLQSIRRTLGFLCEEHLCPPLRNSEEEYTKLNDILAPRPDTKLLDSYIDLLNYEATVNNALDIKIPHNVVSKLIFLYDDHGEASVIPPECLSECDVFVLNHEDTELNILSKLKQTVRSIIVETHGHYGAPTSTIRELIAVNDVTYEQLISKSEEVAVPRGNLKQ